MPLSPINMKSPFELMFGEKPNVKHFRIFNSICCVHVLDSQRSKSDAKARKCIFIGYDEGKKGWKCMDPNTLFFVVSRDVVFYEISLYYKKDGIDRASFTELPISSTSPSSSSPLNIEKQSNRGSPSLQHQRIHQRWLVCKGQAELLSN